MTSRLRTVSAKAVLAVLVLVATVSPAPAQDLDGTLKKIKTSGTLVLGYRVSSPPFSSIGADKQPVGYSIDLCLHVATAVQKHLGLADLELRWVPVTPDTRIDAVARGTVDLECGSTTASLSRQEEVDFSVMTFVDGGGLLTMAAGAFKGLEDLGNRRIGIVPGTTTEKALAEFLAREFVALFSYEPYGLMLRRNDAAFRLVVNRALAELYRSARIAGVYDRWFGAFGRPSQALQSMYLLNALPE
jgi:glutamate/aspartate transport system substrate-binding protein